MFAGCCVCLHVVVYVNLDLSEIFELLIRKAFE